MKVGRPLAGAKIGVDNVLENGEPTMVADGRLVLTMLLHCGAPQHALAVQQTFRRLLRFWRDIVYWHYSKIIRGNDPTTTSPLLGKHSYTFL